MSLGVLSVHLEGAPCAVGCPFCYLAAREPEAAPRRLPVLRETASNPVLELERAIERLPCEELAIAVSEPVPRSDVRRLVDAARRRGLPIAITTTREIADADPQLLEGVARLNLSVDPWKLAGADMAQLVAEVARVSANLKAAHPSIEVIAIATLSTPRFAQALVEDGVLAALVDEPSLDGVALNALKPPPPFCDRAFWLSTLGRLRPLLDRALDRRLFLDCYVAARLLGIGGCPGRPDLSPANGGRIAFRSCVYAPSADVVVDRTDELAPHVAGFVAPAVCPFDTRLG